MSNFQIGWYIVPEDREYTDRGYECAAWYKTILVKAGKYPVTASKFSYHERDKKYTNQLEDMAISIRLDGIVTSDDFAGRFCGQLISDNPKFDKYVGQEDCIYLRPYCHAEAHAILNGNSKVELFPEYQAQEIPFEYDGEQKKTYGIFKIGE